jgi:5'-methylthioadenosine phosphorylase
MTLAIIGGSGLTGFAEIEKTRREVVRTPYGEPSGPLTFGLCAGVEVVFLPRHGYGHTLPPHDINYRANMWALHHVGVDAIVSVASVGGISQDLGPGSIVVVDQIIDYTWGRASTYFDSPDMPVTHIDFTQPFDAGLRNALLEIGEQQNERLVDGGVYACTQGPRLESAAEINRLARDGADVVGMTLMPETALARELEMRYLGVAVVVNHAAGRGDSKLQISVAEMGSTLDATMARVRTLLLHFVQHKEAQKVVA